jgi:tetratricopeptide (TPR) repeat protein
VILLILTIYSTNPLINLADSLYSNRNFFDAATEYERFLYNFPADSNVDYVCFKLGLAYLENNETVKGERLIRNIINTSNLYSRKAQLILAKNFVHNSQFKRARFEIQDLLIFADDTIENQKLNRILGWLHLAENELAKAEHYFSVAKDSELVTEIQNFSRLPRKNPFIAVLLSSIIPGSGEIYSGQYWTGLASFLVNAAAVAGTVLSIKKENYLDAALILSIFFNRFYSGSRQNAYDFATEYNEKLYRTKINKIRQSHNLFSNH